MEGGNISVLDAQGYKGGRVDGEDSGRGGELDIPACSYEIVSE